MASRSNSKTITLKSNDGLEFVVSDMVAMQSKTLRQMIEQKGTQSTIPVPNVEGKILAKVIDYCQMHLDAADALRTETTDEGSSTKPVSSKLTDKELEKWEQEFLDVDHNTIFDLILAANCLKISMLLDAACEKVAKMLAGKSRDEIRQIFNIYSEHKVGL